MTNEDIIFGVRLQLLEAGKIGTTGRILETVGDGGEVEKILEPEEIHTFAVWQSLGYSVKRGEHAVAKVLIWKQVSAKRKNTDSKKEEEETEEKMIQKLAYFFAPSQVVTVQEEVSK